MSMRMFFVDSWRYFLLNVILKVLVVVTVQNWFGIFFHLLLRWGFRKPLFLFILYSFRFFTLQSLRFPTFHSLRLPLRLSFRLSFRFSFRFPIFIFHKFSFAIRNRIKFNLFFFLHLISFAPIIATSRQLLSSALIGSWIHTTHFFNLIWINKILQSRYLFIIAYQINTSATTTYLSTSLSFHHKKYDDFIYLLLIKKII